MLLIAGFTKLKTLSAGGLVVSDLGDWEVMGSTPVKSLSSSYYSNGRLSSDR